MPNSLTSSGLTLQTQTTLGRVIGSNKVLNELCPVDYYLPPRDEYYAWSSKGSSSVILSQMASSTGTRYIAPLSGGAPCSFQWFR